jgi:adenosylcobyric acid synthase
MKAKSVMIQGTSSQAGKSLVVTALCRIFKQDGIKVSPFKSQNMSNNAFVTFDGREISHAQAVQAEASMMEPIVEINPILLKPTTDSKASIILKGRAISNMEIKEYDRFKKYALKVVRECYEKLSKEFQLIVIEGAGSPAEVNLKKNDIANMKIAFMAKSPVILVADIDRGGVFANIVGTLALLTPKEKKMVKGLIINKFRGDLEILRPGIDYLEKRYKIPVLGVIPYFEDIYISKEDSMDIPKSSVNREKKEVEIVIIRLPRISNFTDFESFEREEVNLKFINRASQIKEPDLLIIPGSKNTIADLIFMKDNQIDKEIKRLNQKGRTVILGICGGFQMLGRRIKDEHNIESDFKEIEGLSLLKLDTSFNKRKKTFLIEAELDGLGKYIDFKGTLTGYEIHNGESIIEEDFAFKVKRGEYTYKEGCVNSKGTVIGTYIHGIFNNNEFRGSFLNYLRKRKNLPLKGINYLSREEDYNKLADKFRRYLNLDKLYQIIEDGI